MQTKTPAQMLKDNDFIGLAKWQQQRQTSEFMEKFEVAMAEAEARLQQAIVEENSNKVN